MPVYRPSIIAAYTPGCAPKKQSGDISLAAYRAEPGDFGRMAALVDHDRALERNNDDAILVVAGRAHRHDANVWTRGGLARRQHLRLGVDGIALEDRMRQPHIVPAEIGEDVLRN